MKRLFIFAAIAGGLFSTAQATELTAVTTGNRTFPTDLGGMINVKTAYGAKGDGKTDDTAAIQNAISSNVQGVHHVLYFPNGTYMISNTLTWKNLSGKWQSYMTLQGESQTGTIIKLTPNNKNFQSVQYPYSMLKMGSEGSGSGANAVGGGDDGFDNYVFDMTFDVGSGNPGSVGVDFFGNNYCGMRQVRIQSSDSAYRGVTGLLLTRDWVGPCLMNNVSVVGFTNGVQAGNTEYSITFDNLSLSHQTGQGILNNNNVLSIEGLVSNNSVPAINNSGSNGLITLIGAQMTGGLKGTSAIVNSGAIYARSLTGSGYSSMIADATGKVLAAANSTEYLSAPVTRQIPSTATLLALNLPIQQTPYFEEQDLTKWKSVVAEGADATGKVDSTVAIQKAIDSGATTVYFPNGTYMVHGTIYVRGAVRMLKGFDSTILPVAADYPSTNAIRGLFEIEDGTAANVTLDHFHLGTYTQTYASMIHIIQDSNRPLILKDSVYYNQLATQQAYANTKNGTGPLFLEDIAGGPWVFKYAQKVFARQLDVENPVTKVTNEGCDLWILGWKSEQAGTNILTNEGGSTEVLGGLVYPLGNIPVDQSAFIVNDASASFTYAASSYVVPSATAPDGDFKVQVSEWQGGSHTYDLESTSVKARGYGIMMPLYRSK
jgi:hypothetical protein